MNRTSIATMLVLISALIIDTITSNIYELVSKEEDSSWGHTFFMSASAIILVVGMILLLGPIEKQAGTSGQLTSFNKAYKYS
jgi:hypothetical protein